MSDLGNTLLPPEQSTIEVIRKLLSYVIPRDVGFRAQHLVAVSGAVVFENQSYSLVGKLPLGDCRYAATPRRLNIMISCWLW